MPIVHLYLGDWNRLTRTATYHVRHTEDGRGSTVLDWRFRLERSHDEPQKDGLSPAWFIHLPEDEHLAEDTPRKALLHMATWFERMAASLRVVSTHFPNEDALMLVADTGPVVYGRGDEPVE